MNIEESVFRHNTASVGGGIEFGSGTTAQVRDCLFVGNVASGSRFGFAGYGGGGIVVVNGANATITGSTFVGNSTDHIAANDGGGAVYALNSTCVIRNSVFWENEDLSGMTQDGQVKRSGGTLTLARSLVMGLNGSLGGIGNLGVDPMFADAPGGDYRAGAGSPIVDAGDNAFDPDAMGVDLDGAPRFVDAVLVADTGAGSGAIIDMGAYEAPANLGCPGDLNLDGAVGAGDLAVLLAGWGAPGDGDLDGSGSVGAGDLAVLLAAWGGC